MTSMNVLNCRLATLAIAAMSTYAWAQAPANLPVIKTRFEQVTATVEAIDPAKRELSLRGPKRSVSVAVGDDVKNFDSIHVGDKVIVSYYEGLAVQMAKGGMKATEPAASTFDYRAASGQRPGGGTGASTTVTVTIEGIEGSTNTVAFKTPDGALHMVAVKSPNMVQFLHTLKRGDSVDVTYTESLAVKVVPAPG